MKKKKISIVVPCYNEQAVLAALHNQISEVAASWDLDWDVICVNDGSSDRTLEMLKELNQEDPRWHYVSFSRNFGHQKAVSAGIDYSDADAVVLLDADLQDPPEVIGKFIDKWNDGWDIVYGVRKCREGETRFKRATARAFYRLLNKLSEVPIPVDTGDFRLMDRRAVEALKSMPERDRFIRGMVSWVGFKQCPVYYDRKARFAGDSKYPLARMLKFSATGILSFSSAPLRLAGSFGVVCFMLSLLGMSYALILRLFTDHWVSGWTLLFLAIMFLGGVQLLAIGIIGEYIGRIYDESKRRPLYIVDDVSITRN